jgi:hypothetical protein
VAEAFDSAKWQDLSLESINTRVEALSVLPEEIVALRGAARSADYSASSTYVLGATVWETTSAREYLCIDPVTTPEAFNTARWQELSVRNNARGTTIRDRLEELTGTARLDASAIQNLNLDGDAAFQPVVEEIFVRDGLTSGATLTKAQADEIVRRTLGIDAFWATDNSRIMPIVSQSNNSFMLWRNSEIDETGAGACIELVLPAESVRGKALTARFTRSSTIGTRMFRVYDGNPVNLGVEIDPILGNEFVLRGSQATTVWDLERPDGVAGDIHIIVQRQGIFDLQLVDNSAYHMAALKGASFSEAAALVNQQTGLVNGELLGTHANDIVQGMGIGAEFRTTAGRQYPRMFGNGAGLFSASFGDETAATADVCELVIPASRLSHNQVLEVTYGQVTTGGTERDVRVYPGDPTTGVTKLTPIEGTEAHTGAATTYWNVSTTPENDGAVTTDLHIVFSRVTVNNIAVHTNLPLSSDTGAPERLELRGGARPTEFSATQAYSAGDSVYRTADNRTFIAREDLTAGPWDAANWYEASTLSNAALVLETSVGISDAHEQLRGQAVAADFDSTATYAIDDSCVFGNRLYHAIAAVLPGNFDASEWQVISIVDNEGRIDTAEVDIEALRGAARPADFDSTATYTAGTYVIYLSRLYKARTGVAAGAWDVAEWQIVSAITNENRIEAVEGDIVSLRGAAAYNVFNIANNYAIGAYVSHLGRDYVAIATVTAGAFNAADWEELSLQAINNRLGFTPLELIDDIESVAEANRLESWAVQNVFSKYAKHAKTIADRDSIADDEALSVAQSTEILRTFGVGVTTARTALAYYDDADSWGVYAPSGGQDPTDAGHAYSEVIFTGKDLTGGSYITFFISDIVSGLTRELRVFNGDATASGTEILPVVGTNSGATAHAVTYQVPANSADIYVYLGRQILLDVEFHTSLGQSTGTQIRDELEALTGTDRLDSSAIQNLNIDGTGTFQNVFREIAVRDAIPTGTTLTKAQGDELLERTLVPGTAWRDTNSRIMPFASLTAGSWWFWLNSSVDETGDGAVAEFIIPAQEARGKVLQARFARGSATGDRHFRVYRGDPTSGGVVVDPVYGQESNVYGALQTVVWNLDSALVATDDYHVVVQRQGVYDLQVVSNAPFMASDIRGSGFGSAALKIFEDFGVTNGIPLNTLADDMVEGLGVSASFRRDAGRSFPLGFGSGAGFFTNVFADETSASADVCELVVPAGALTHNMVLEIRYGQVTSSGTDRDIRVYEGNPVGGGATKIDPVVGTEAHTNTDTTYWTVSTTPGAGGLVTNDLHIVFARVAVTNIKFHADVPVGSDTGIQIRDKLEALTGTERLNVSAIEGASTDIITVVHPNHPFTQQQLLARGAGANWAPADASSMAPATGFVCEVVDIGTYRVQSSGICTITGHGYTTGQYYWLNSAGTFTSAQPVSGLIQEVFQVIDDDTILIGIGQPYLI